MLLQFFEGPNLVHVFPFYAFFFFGYKTRASSEQRPRTRSCHESDRLVQALFRSNAPFGKSFSRSSSQAAGNFSQRRLENSLSS